MSQPERHILAVCFDFGDTLCDEATEVKDESQTTLRAELIPGAAETVLELKRRGYRLALVADGRPGTYRNVLGYHGLYDLFDAHVISEELGCEKPDERMFVQAMERLGIERVDYGRTLMVGNNLSRDVKGANQVGMVSVWLDWSPRRAKIPADEMEAPHYTIRQPAELLGLVEWLEGEAAGYSR
jgi:putative hydrolase of the HAD superfamily